MFSLVTLSWSHIFQKLVSLATPSWLLIFQKLVSLPTPLWLLIFQTLVSLATPSWHLSHQSRLTACCSQIEVCPVADFVWDAAFCVRRIKYVVQFIVVLLPLKSPI